MTYIDNKDGTITDTLTGLMWQKDTLSTMSYDNAVLSCSKLDLAGHRDWRLPTIKELCSLVDYHRCDPACHVDLVDITRSGFYWSSTRHQYWEGYAWGVGFYLGIVGVEPMQTEGAVRAVRILK